MADSQDDHEVTRALVRLMRADFDPSGMTDEELIAARDDARDTARRTDAVVAAELYRRTNPRSWRTVGKMLGVSYSAARGWAIEAGLVAPAVDEEDG